uniref:5-hydroxytryptamine receptor 3A-like n=1 Tax=Gouania willdenowi TaxID=441366 RepID=A0A8C5DDS9_GOUWI
MRESEALKEVFNRAQPSADQITHKRANTHSCRNETCDFSPPRHPGSCSLQSDLQLPGHPGLSESDHRQQCVQTDAARPGSHSAHRSPPGRVSLCYLIEKTQTFVPFVWCSMRWINERIKWDPAHFCGIDRVSIPHEMVWKPDLFIYEMIEKDDSPKSPYLFLYNDGSIFKEEGLRIVSACNMDVHKFPFDTQKCNISIGSTLHCSEGLKCLKRTNKKLYHVFSFFLSLILSPPSTVDELLLQPFSNSSRATQFSKELIRIHGEWEFLHLLVSKSNLSYHDRLWDQLVYTVTMRRKPLLHVLNFLLPVLFFLTLDLASFFIADHRGEKLGFKITVLLAISVLLLILNDILPSMSSRTPLIGTGGLGKWN